MLTTTTASAAAKKYTYTQLLRKLEDTYTFDHDYSGAIVININRTPDDCGTACLQRSIRVNGQLVVQSKSTTIEC